MLEFRLLKALITLDEERSVSAAARRLHVTQPAMSATLRKLREHFDDPMFVRSARGLIPNERAEQVLLQARQIASMMDALEQDAAGFHPERDRLDLRIAASEFIHSVFLPPLMQSLLREAPGVRLIMQPLSLDSIEQDFENDILDFAILPDFLASTNLQIRKLFDETFVYLMRRDHPMSRGALSVEDLASCKHIRVLPSSTDRLDRVGKVFKNAKLNRDVRITVNNYVSAVELVATTDLITLLPERMTGQLNDRFVTRPAPFDLKPISMCLVWHPKKQTTKAHKWARQFMAGVAKTMDQEGE